MNIIAWIVFGAIVGWLANIIDPRPARGGLLSTIVLGVLGALLGGFLGTLIFGVGVTGFDLPSFIVSVIGALILLAAGRVLARS